MFLLIFRGLHFDKPLLAFLQKGFFFTIKVLFFTIKVSFFTKNVFFYQLKLSFFNKKSFFTKKVVFLPKKCLFLISHKGKWRVQICTLLFLYDSSTSKQFQKHKKTEKVQNFEKSIVFFVKIRTKRENKKLNFAIFDSRECLTAV